MPTAFHYPDFPSNASAQEVIAVTPSDGTDLQLGGRAVPCRGFVIGGAGAIAIDTANGTTVTITGLAAGVIHWIAAKRIRATGTLATNIVALY